jgi:hypothetical protein
MAVPRGYPPRARANRDAEESVPRCRNYRIAEEAGGAGARGFRHRRGGVLRVPMNEAPEDRDEGPADDEELVEDEAEAAERGEADQEIPPDGPE